MRKKRAVLIDDEPIIIDALKIFFEERGYEVLSYKEPVICPIYYGPHECKQQRSCSDVILMEDHLPRMNGLNAFREQAKRGCRMNPSNKAIMTGSLDDAKIREAEALGAAFFLKPLDFGKLAEWVGECEKRIDLSVPLGIRRKEVRFICRREVTYQAPTYYAPASGLAVNMSSSGICLVLSTPLPPEQRVRLHSNVFIVPQNASVRWIRKIDSEQYMAGLQYMQ